MYKADDGTFVVHPRHQLLSAEGVSKLLKSAEVGFALVEYSNGDNVDPVLLPFAMECHRKFLAREAREASGFARQRRQTATAQAPQASASACTKKRRTPATASAQGRQPTTAKRSASTRAPSTRSLTQTLPA